MGHEAHFDKLDVFEQPPARPALSEAAREPTPEVKGFVDGYLRKGRESEIKSVSGVVPQDGGYAVPREIDALIARELKEISPIRQIAQIVQTGTRCSPIRPTATTRRRCCASAGARRA